MLNTQSEIVTRAGHMTEAEYDRERAKIAKTKAEAGVRWEQELARLFHRSGWTQAELAKKEGKSHQLISNLIKFGEFLAFSENASYLELSQILPKLAVGRFVDYWGQTSGGKRRPLVNDRERFREVARRILAEHEGWLKIGHRKPPIPKAIGQTIAKTCPKGKWVAPDAIASKADCTVENVHSVMDSMDRKPGSYGMKAERKKVGKEVHYRVFKQDKLVSSDELVTKLTPIIKGLEVEGKKHSAHRVEAEIARLAALLKRLLDEWAE
jgi:transcriptional regulator with XRE-family HTH domain